MTYYQNDGGQKTLKQHVQDTERNCQTRILYSVKRPGI